MDDDDDDDDDEGSSDGRQRDRIFTENHLRHHRKIIIYYTYVM